MKEKTRLIFIDVMRGLAVLWMIETHVVDACLSEFLKTGWFYNLLNISNGFVAVGFLFCAGAGFWLAAMKKSDDYRHFRKPLIVYLRRLGLILLFAYWLHLPVLSLRRTFNLSYNEMLIFFQFDVLQTIVISSLVALLLLMVIPKMKILPYIYGALALVTFYIAPLVWNTDPLSSMPVFFGTWFAKLPISKFPLLPWSGYFFAGAALTSLFYNVQNKRKFAWIVAGIGFIIPFIVFIIKDSSLTYPGFDDWWHCSPGHSWFRVSIVALIFSLLYLFEDYYKNRRIGAVLQVAGQESLFLYISHLMIVYGSVVDYGLKYFVNNNLDWFSTWLMVIAICTFCYFMCKIWHNIKAANMRNARVVMAVVVGVFFVLYAVLP